MNEFWWQRPPTGHKQGKNDQTQIGAKTVFRNRESQKSKLVENSIGGKKVHVFSSRSSQKSLQTDKYGARYGYLKISP